jgi:hypothetical protein
MKRDWFDCEDDAEKDAAKAEFLAGPTDMDSMGPNVWGRFGFVICKGDLRTMRAAAKKMFNDKFHAMPCPMGNYSDDVLMGWQTVAHRVAV